MMDGTDTSRIEEAALPDNALVIRPARTSDGPEMWRIVRDSGELERNSCYAYLTMCRDFGDSSAVAVERGRVIGFVLAYRPPREPSVVFVWQVGVDAAARGRGIAGRLLRAVVSPGRKGVRFLETTVTPSNEPSLRLFFSFARRMKAPITKLDGFDADAFRYETHEREDRYRIGPFPTE